MEINSFRQKSATAVLAAWQLVARSALLPGAAIEHADPQWVLRALPLVGLVIGASLWVMSAFLNVLLMNALVAAVCGALLVPAWSWWLTRAKGLVGLTHTSANWSFSRTAGSEAVTAYVPLLVVQSLMILKVLAVGILIYMQMGGWLVLVPLLGITAFGQLTIARQLPEDEQSLIHWAAAAVAAVVVSALLGILIAGLFATIIAWLAAPAVNVWLHRHSAAEQTHQAPAVLELVELLVLWIGVLAV